MGNCLGAPTVAPHSPAAPVVRVSPHGPSMDPPKPVAVPQPGGSPKQTPKQLDGDKRRAAKRIAVAAEAIANTADIVVPDVPKTEYAARLIDRATAGNLLFESLSQQAKLAIIRSMRAEHYKAGDTVIMQGDTVANKFYVIERGTADVYVQADSGEQRKVASYQPGSGFGELALLYSAPRAATVLATSDCKVWVMERTIYNAIKRTFGEQIVQEKRVLLDSVPLLALLNSNHKQLLVDALEMVEFEAGHTVFRQGDRGDKLYIIKQGTVVLQQDGKEVKRLGEKASFGEQALLKDEARDATAVAGSQLVCYALARLVFNDMLGPIEDVWRFETLRKAPVLVNLREHQIFQLARCMTRVDFAAGEVVFRQGDPGDAFYVVEDGAFSITNREGRELALCAKGQCFGELALLKSEPRAATVTAITASKALACTREDFDKHLGSLQEIANLWRFEALKKVPLLAPLSAQQKLALCAAFTSVKARNGEAVVTKGEPGDTFYIIEKGSCVVVNEQGQELAKLGTSAYFGERALLLNEPRAATVRAAGDVTLLTLDRGAFTRLLGPLQKLLERQAASYYIAQPTKITKPLKLEDLKQVAVLGCGAFGRVSLVKYEGHCFALKVLSKAHVIQSGLQEHIKREKVLMEEFASPFLVNMVASFKDSQSLYMLLELVQGGEFFSYLQTREAPLREDDARFYTACVVMGLEYMHDRSIAWRDLKPENLLIDTTGYLKITDFGFAKKIPSGSKSYTLCGTPEYLAPELVSQSGHSSAVDWWAVGVLVYEMVAGFPPFYQEDRVAMFRAICNIQYSFPSHFSKELRDLIKHLLVRSPGKRLGASGGGATEVKSHPWFQGFDWDALAQRRLKAPYVPRVSGADDTSNFDTPTTNPLKRTSRYMSTGVFQDF